MLRKIIYNMIHSGSDAVLIRRLSRGLIIQFVPNANPYNDCIILMRRGVFPGKAEIAVIRRIIAESGAVVVNTVFNAPLSSRDVYYSVELYIVRNKLEVQHVMNGE
ncbi:MAG: hypothetical protein CUN56_08895 [Phototrophicales bacterium]|nr:MAG: hypothetical protein CUN56_08895 [Phototrophicales bacterium]